MAKPTVLFLCTGNSCRSHMAEGLLRHLAGDRFEVMSAGSHPAGYLHPLAIAAMREIGVDISTQTSKGLYEFGCRVFDYVVTVCDHAAAACPMLRGRIATIHWPINDPAAVQGTNEERMAAARRVRDELRSRIEAFLTTLNTPWHSGPPR